MSDTAFVAAGVPVTTDQRDRAWAAWIALPDDRRTAFALQCRLAEAGVPNGVRDEAAMRASDRMIQSARKRGEIEFVSRGKWWRILSGRENG